MNVLVSADNPGGANAIVSVVKKLSQYTAYVSGAAKDVFRAADLEFIDADSLSEQELIEKIKEQNFDLFFAGTSMGDTVDKKLLPWCKENKIPSVYVLDFWSNYRIRFDEVLPDYICVMDEKAKEEMVAEGFAADSVIVTGNPYFDHFIDGITTDNEKHDQILFVSQPLDGLNYGYTELEVLNDLAEIISQNDLSFELIVRFHPRDDKNKYDNIITEFDFVSVDDKSIAESLSRAGLVVGMNSILLFQAAVAGKKVISYQPNLNRKDVLVSNDLGLSELITDKDELVVILKKYFDGSDNLKNEQINEVVVPNATENVLNFIQSV